MPKAEKGSKGKAKPEKKEKAKKEKKKKDPNAPKKPLSAYMFFCADHREVIKKENPDLKFTEITSELGKVWGGMSESEKKKYYEKAEKDKARYQKAIASYKPAAGSGDDEGDEEEEEDDE